MVDAGPGRRWIDGGYVNQNLAVVGEDVVAISTTQMIKFIFTTSGKQRLYNPGGESDGIGVMSGRDEDGLLAWTELRINPRVFVYQYTNPGDLKVFQGEAVMEYKSLGIPLHQPLYPFIPMQSYLGGPD
ncbi:uncharacterized protein LOC111706075 [Eurytemora carolleeae]|uniref:uncharacterized protein LOC111706075 n=1 Tax=Eurytemora carolleeae TaxID=1294199 RepID=UPI000C763738|nr:uncharacterized protein LOC111706075 [Eurytemora carolleeae]|eukprot:XP_023334601.1 uncharacterized protein LOC111706075 [Eurytemora affinis]